MTVLAYTDQLADSSVGFVPSLDFLTNSWNEDNEPVEAIPPYYVGDEAFYNNCNEAEPYSNNQMNIYLRGETI